LYEYISINNQGSIYIVSSVPRERSVQCPDHLAKIALFSNSINDRNSNMNTTRSFHFIYMLCVFTI